MNLFGLPKELQPNGTYPIILPSTKKKVLLQKCTPIFPVWVKTPPKFSFGNKRFLDFKGEPVFAEIYILRLLKEASWNCVWVETYGGFKFLQNMPESSKLISIELPSLQAAFMQTLRKATGKGGIFDIFAWRGDDFVFCESKERGKDRFQKTQNLWVESVLKLGIKLESLLVVDWSIK